MSIKMSASALILLYGNMIVCSFHLYLFIFSFIKKSAIANRNCNSQTQCIIYKPNLQFTPQFTNIFIIMSASALILALPFLRFVLKYVHNQQQDKDFKDSNILNSILYYLRYYMLLLLIAPTIFLLPRFFEIKTMYRLYRLPKTYNCSEQIANEMENELELRPTILENYSITTINSTISSNFFHQENQIEVVCNKSQYLMNSFLENEVPPFQDNESDNCAPRLEIVNPDDYNSVSSQSNTTLHMDYNIRTQIARVCSRHLRPILDRTDLRKNPLYYKIYILGLTTLFAQIIPIAILIYLNIRIYMALRTTPGDYINRAIRKQRKGNPDARNEGAKSK